MKRTLFIIVAALFIATGAHSQEIYKEVLKLKNNVQTLMNDTTKSLEARKIACFKNDALYYLIDKAADDEEFTEFELGRQANAMIDFVNLFVKRLSAERKKKDKDIILYTYKNATTGNPLFHDPDKEVTYGYVDNDNYLTQFSIDTDWVKALEAVAK